MARAGHKIGRLNHLVYVGIPDQCLSTALFAGVCLDHSPSPNASLDVLAGSAQRRCTTCVNADTNARCSSFNDTHSSTCMISTSSLPQFLVHQANLLARRHRHDVHPTGVVPTGVRKIRSGWVFSNFLPTLPLRSSKFCSNILQRSSHLCAWFLFFLKMEKPNIAELAHSILILDSVSRCLTIQIELSSTCATLPKCSRP